MNNTFDEFVKKQVQSAGNDSAPLDVEGEKRRWLAKLDELYLLARQSLSKWLEDGSIGFELSNVTLNEELLGSYTAQQASIRVGRQLVRMRPVGTFLIGASGRVDLIGPKGKARFVLVPPDVQSFRVSVTIRVGEEQEPPAAVPMAERANDVWKIATPPPRITYIDLTPETFRETLMGVIDG